MTGYFDELDDAETLADAMLGLTAYKAASDDDKTAALEQAAEEIDAIRFQGRKFDPSQAREFPRLAYASGSPLPSGLVPVSPLPLVPDGVWDWDADAEAAIVPPLVQKMNLLQADYILAGTRATLLARWQAGITAQSIGSGSETYQLPSFGSLRPEETLLHPEVRAKLAKYRLRSGEMI